MPLFDRDLHVETLALFLRECREGGEPGARTRVADAMGVPATTARHRIQRARRDPSIVADAEALASSGVPESRTAATEAAPEPKPLPKPKGPTQTVEVTRQELTLLRSFRERMEREGFTDREVEGARLKRVKLWQTAMRGAEEPEVVDLSGFTLEIDDASGPAWPVVEPGPPVEIRHAEIRERARAGTRTAVVLPDMQVGHWLDGDVLVPVHDRRAVDLARQVVRIVEPDVIVMVGDNLDLPAQSRHKQIPAFAQTTQASIDEMTTICAGLRADAPKAEIVWIAGNHDERLPRYILDNAAAAFGIRRGNLPESWPVMSVPHLCRLDDSDVRFLPGYPSCEYWINDRLRVIHGHHVRSKGSTAHVYLGEDRHSTIFGHVHRVEMAMRTRHTRHGPRTTLAACFGALCRVDGAVPSVSTGMDHDGRPVGRTQDWQQGLGVVTFEPGDGEFSVEPVYIFDGWTRYRGRELVARVGLDGEVAA